jgi:hypothetical protein
MSIFFAKINHPAAITVQKVMPSDIGTPAVTLEGADTSCSYLAGDKDTIDYFFPGPSVISAQPTGYRERV